MDDLLDSSSGTCISMIHGTLEGGGGSMHVCIVCSLHSSTDSKMHFLVEPEVIFHIDAIDIRL